MLCITQGTSECGAASSCRVGGINMLCPIQHHEALQELQSCIS